MIDFKLLESLDKPVTNDRLREIFTAEPPKEPSALTAEQKKRIERDVEIRKHFEKKIQGIVDEQILFALKNQLLYAAVDLAWDGPPITKETLPLMRLAQGKLDVPQCLRALGDLKLADKYSIKDASGKVTGVELPKFIAVECNLLRSAVTRRLSAIAQKYHNLYPAYKYESRSTTQVGKLRADALSQRVDMMADQYSMRQHDDQVCRDMLLYAHSVDFVRAAWEKERQWRYQPVPENLPDAKPEREEVVVKEGLSWVNPHISRVFSDIGHPLSSINSDTGCETLGYWDVVRFSSVGNNLDYFNRAKVSFSHDFLNLFDVYSSYFNQYFCTIKPPTPQHGFNMAGNNDRVSNLGRYTSAEDDSACLLAYVFLKLVPKDWDMGDYPHPVWFRFIWAGNGCVVFAEKLPSSPACYCGYNEKDDRLVNLSFAMSIMPYQDLMTNLLNQLLALMKLEQLRLVGINTDMLSAEDQTKLRRKIDGENWFLDPMAIFYSASASAQLGLDKKGPFDVWAPPPNNQAITDIFLAMARLIELMERLESMSPNESGQPIVRGNGGVSATEANLISGTTTAVHAFLCDGIDDFRAAKKRIIYESLISCGEDRVVLPVLNRYPKSIIKAAGFEVVDEDGTGDLVALPQSFTIVGRKRNLEHDFIFTSRDGAERESNTQTATTLLQMIPLLQNPLVMAAMGKTKFFEIINEIGRKSGSGVDFNLEVAPGEDEFAAQPDQQLAGLTDQLTQLMDIVQRNTGDIQGLEQALHRGPAQPPPRPQIMPSGAPPMIPPPSPPSGPSMGALVGR